jgi:hypothetical protein
MGKRNASWLLIGLCSLILFCPETCTASIGNIKAFLDTCPKNDPAYNQIKSDFTIRHNGVIVPADSIACSEPVSSLPIAQYTDELIILQSLRAIYYMDYGQGGHLPWTAGSLYQWMKSKIKGINIKDGAGANSCCDYTWGNPPYFTFQPNDAQQREFDRHWKNLSGVISLFAHEIRHVDGFPHPSCCTYARCDQTFDPSNLSPIGIQWWLNKLWLTGEINVGAACLDPVERQDTINWHLDGANSEIISFCNNKPPYQTVPATALGSCRAPSPLPWKTQTVDSALDFGRYASLAVDPANNLTYISYYDATSGHLRLANPVTSGGNCGPANSWLCRTIDDSSNPVGKSSSLDIYRSSLSMKRGVAYIDEAHHSLKYYSYSCFMGICTTAIETVDDTLTPVRFASLKFDSNGLPHIAYQGQPSSGCGPPCSYLKYGRRVGSGGNCGGGKWQCDLVHVFAFDNYGLYPSLDLNGTDQPRIAYYDGAFGKILRYAAACGSDNCGNCGIPNQNWQCDQVDPAGPTGLFPSLTIDKGLSENPRIAYYDKANGKLKLAVKTTSGNCGSIASPWQCDAIADMGAGLLGYAGVSLAVDPAGKPWIAFMDASQDQAPARLRMAQPVFIPGLGNCGPLYTWECATVDGGGSWTNEGSFVSLAFNSQGKPIVAYYEEDNYTDGNLKVATLWDQLFLPLILK